MAVTFIRQIVDKLVNDTLYPGQSSSNLTVDGQTTADINAFKDALEQKLLSDEAESGATLYSADGVIASNRIVNLNGKSVRLQHGGNDFLYIDPLGGVSSLQGYNLTGDTNYSYASASTDNLSATAGLAALFNGETRIAAISVIADAASAIAEHNADTHKFSNIQAFADNAAAITGGLEAGMLYHTAGTIKIVT